MKHRFNIFILAKVVTCSLGASSKINNEAGRKLQLPNYNAHVNLPGKR
jgi:hypothetical protein